jgi:hypothetical protein
MFGSMECCSAIKCRQSLVVASNGILALCSIGSQESTLQKISQIGRFRLTVVGGCRGRRGGNVACRKWGVGYYGSVTVHAQVAGVTTGKSKRKSIRNDFLRISYVYGGGGDFA